MKNSAMVFLFILMGLLANADVPSEKLSISVDPQSPILIPYGSGTTLGNNLILQTPYFTVSTLHVAWTGENNADLVEVTLTSDNSDAHVNCSFTGEDLKNMFPDQTDKNGHIVIPPQTKILSRPFGCGGLQIADPSLSVFNIPVTVNADAVTMGKNNVGMHVVQATTEIVVQ